MKDLYAILGLPPDCEPEEIKAAYRTLVLVHHPDQNPQQSAEAHERFLEIKEAYELLSDPEQREAYDMDFVSHFPGYELDVDEDEEEYEPNPPARMPIEHADSSNGWLRILMVLILPIVAGTFAMLIFDSVTLMVIATLGALAMAIWLGSMLGSDAA